MPSDAVESKLVFSCVIISYYRILCDWHAKGLRPIERAVELEKNATKSKSQSDKLNVSWSRPCVSVVVESEIVHHLSTTCSRRSWQQARNLRFVSGILKQECDLSSSATLTAKKKLLALHSTKRTDDCSLEPEMGLSRQDVVPLVSSNYDSEQLLIMAVKKNCWCSLMNVVDSGGISNFTDLCRIIWGPLRSRKGHLRSRQLSSECITQLYPNNISLSQLSQSAEVFIKAESPSSSRENNIGTSFQKRVHGSTEFGNGFLCSSLQHSLESFKEIGVIQTFWHVKKSTEAKIRVLKITKYCELLPHQYGSVVTCTLRKNFTNSSCHKYIRIWIMHEENVLILPNFISESMKILQQKMRKVYSRHISIPCKYSLHMDIGVVIIILPNKTSFSQ